MSEKSFQSLVEAKEQADVDLYNAVVLIIEQKARDILKRNPKRLKEFVMGMGWATFVKNDGESIDDDDELWKYKGGRDIYDFIDHYDEIFRVKGDPMRFTSKGPKITDW